MFSMEVAKRYPGASWLPYFKSLANSAGYHAVSNLTVGSLLETRQLDASSIRVFQEDQSGFARKLRDLGAYPSVISSLESPLYAGRFYKNLEANANGFRFALLFSGIDLTLSTQTSKVDVCFPSYDPENLEHNHVTRTYRMAFVAGNKYWRRLGFQPQQLLRRAKDGVVGSNYVPEAPLHQLHDERLNFISYFADKGLALFGAGWHDLSNIPKHYRSSIEKSNVRRGPLEYALKRETLSQYRFAACLENYSLNGYITEKIFDALTAGCIPIYLGAPDVHRWIPQNVFVDVRAFRSLQELDRYLHELTPAQCKALRQNGWDFLNSSDGKRFSYQHFAESVLDMMMH